MNALIITYDLKNHATEEQYKRLYNEIHKQGYVQWAQYSVWIVATTKTDVEVRNHLHLFTDNHDSLFVGTLSSYATFNVPDKVTNAINFAWQKNIPLTKSLA